MEEKQLHVLVERSRAGDRAAQEELIAFVQNFVYHHCCKLLDDRESALDVTQEVLLAMVRGLPNLKEPAAFWAWLLKIICNRCRNYQTRRPKECQMPESPNGGTLLDTWAEESAEQLPERALEESETAQLVRQLVDQLPTDQRACILLFYYDELTVREIAAALSVPMATVKTRLHRARKTLRTGLRRHGVSALALTALLSSVTFSGRSGSTTALQLLAIMIRNGVHMKWQKSAMSGRICSISGMSGWATVWRSCWRPSATKRLPMPRKKSRDTIMACLSMGQRFIWARSAYWNTRMIAPMM